MNFSPADLPAQRAKAKCVETIQPHDHFPNAKQVPKHPLVGVLQSFATQAHSDQLWRSCHCQRADFHQATGDSAQQDTQEVGFSAASLPFQLLIVLIDWVSFRVLANYVIWRAVGASVSYLTEDLRSRQLKYSTALSGKETREARWKECIDIVSTGWETFLMSFAFFRFNPLVRLLHKFTSFSEFP